MVSTLKASLLALCAMLLFTASQVRAELVAIPALQTPVTDLTQTLTADQQSQLEAKLKAFEHEKGSQIAVLIVPTTEPEDIAQYSIRVVDAWKLGRGKTDDGVLIVLDVKGKKSRIEVGYGLEGALNDLTAERIRVEVMRPFIRAGDIYGGLNAGVDKIMNVISGEALPEPNATESSRQSFEGMLPILLFGALILGGILRSVFGNFFGGTLTGGAIGALAWILGGGVLAAIIFGIVAFFLTLIGPSGLGQMGGYSGGGFGGGSGGNDTFSGGGGGFGGGGASGDW
ncbi:MAG: YgcG family protein [Methylotenera sp.]|nr:YgcG family protein [Methylotenera sp.]